MFAKSRRLLNINELIWQTVGRKDAAEKGKGEAQIERLDKQPQMKQLCFCQPSEWQAIERGALKNKSLWVNREMQGGGGAMSA